MLKESEIIEKLLTIARKIFDSTGIVKVTRTGFAGTRLLNQDIKPDLVVHVETGLSHFSG